VRPRVNAVLLTLVVIGALALATTGFVAEAPNRLVSGAPVPLWRTAGPQAVAIAVAGVALLPVVLLPAWRTARWLELMAASALLLLSLDAAGAAARTLAAGAPEAARTSLGSAFWIVLLCAALAILDALQRLDAGVWLRLSVAAGLAALAAALILSGRLDQVSLAREFAGRRSAFAAELLRHCALVAGTLGPALMIGLPLGLLAARRPSARGPIYATLNAVQTVPSIALFGLLVAPLAALAVAVPALGALGIHGVGPAPALIALVLYALLPVVRNTEAGLHSVDPAAIEAALAMGMSQRQIFWRIELPLGLPVFMAGVRVVTVQAIGLAAVAALVGAGGLGTFVFQGIGQYAVDLVLLGAVPTILMALAADFLLAMVIEGMGR
jgi:osmoprotectant transport system permease protein